MKKFLPPVICLLLCAILLLSCVRIAFGAEVEPASPCCFRTRQEGLTVYRCPLSLEYVRGDAPNSVTCCYPELFALEDREKREGTVSAYPLLPGASLRPDDGYRRSDLEDQPDLDRASAERLRAVLRNSYPAKDLRSIQLSANAWLEEQAEIRELQLSEAVLATQAAVWTLAGAGNGTYLQRLIVPSDPEAAAAARNVQSLYAYLITLPGESGRYDTVSDASLTDLWATYRQEEDGTRTVTLSVTVDTTVSKQDYLTVTASWGALSQSQLVTGAGEYHFTFRGVEDAQEAAAALSGQQYGSDVYVFRPEEGSGPALLSYHSGIYPVYTQRTAGLLPEMPAEPAEE